MTVPFNTSIIHRPILTVRATSPADVQQAVRHAGVHQHPITIQATGHGAVAAAQGVLLDTSGLGGVTVDPLTRTARVGAGTRWGEVITAAGRYGLAPLNGSSPLVGVVGYTLGGGLGPMARTFGYAADRVRRIELVTPAGERAIADPSTNVDLFWALRGGKAGFGVVTALEIELVPVERLYGGAIHYPGRTAAAVIDTWLDWTSGLPETLTSSLALLRVPDLVVAVRIAFVGSAADGERLVRPLRMITPPVRDTVGPMPYTSVAEIHADPTEGNAYRERSLLLGELDARARATLIDSVGPEPSNRDVMIELRHLGGAVARSPREPNAVGHRDAAYSLSTITPAGAESRVLEELQPWGVDAAGRPRRYINFLSGAISAREVAECYPLETLDALDRLRVQHDPSALFAGPFTSRREVDHAH